MATKPFLDERMVDNVARPRATTALHEVKPRFGQRHQPRLTLLILGVFRQIERFGSELPIVCYFTHKAKFPDFDTSP
jgi:hypothetical protein